MGFEDSFALFAEFGNEGFCVWGVEEVEEGVCYGLGGMLGGLTYRAGDSVEDKRCWWYEWQPC